MMKEALRAHSYRHVFVADMLLVFVAFIWGAGIPITALLSREITPLWAVALRMLFASFFLIVMFPRKYFLQANVTGPYLRSLRQSLQVHSSP